MECQGSWAVTTRREEVCEKTWVCIGHSESACVRQTLWRTRPTRGAETEIEVYTYLMRGGGLLLQSLELVLYLHVAQRHGVVLVVQVLLFHAHLVQLVRHVPGLKAEMGNGTQPQQVATW